MLLDKIEKKIKCIYTIFFFFQVPLITPRGVMLAALFMQGVEHALIANDACGAPISWLMCCPWLFFDGKIFHRKLLKANSAKNLLDLCDNRVRNSF